jgi:hypothetical protein
LSSLRSLSDIILQAIEWAIEEKVDIILIGRLTYATGDPQELLLREAVKKAIHTTSPTLVFCPTADEGVFPVKNFPARHERAIKVVAATDMYTGWRLALQDNIDILIPIEDIKVDLPDYMEEYISGFKSSVATALASGTASLVLLLFRIFNNDRAALQNFFQKYTHGFMVYSA